MVLESWTKGVEASRKVFCILSVGQLEMQVQDGINPRLILDGDLDRQCFIHIIHDHNIRRYRFHLVVFLVDSESAKLAKQ